MDCKETKEKIVDLRDGVLDSVALKAVTEHLLTCKDCSAALQALKKTDELLEKWPGLEPSADFEDRLQQRIDADEEKTKKTKKTWFYFSMAAAAAVAAIVVFQGKIFLAPAAEVMLKAARIEGKVVIVSGGFENELTASLNIKEGDVLKAGYKSGVDIEVTENSTVRLKENSQARVEKSREKGGTEEYVFELMTGELLAKVQKKGAVLNFAVKTPNSTVNVTGTAFKVLVVGEYATSVLVSEGTVNVSKNGNSGESCSVLAGNYVMVSNEESFQPEVFGEREKAELEELKTLKETFDISDPSKDPDKIREKEREMKEDKECEPPEKTDWLSTDKAVTTRGWSKGIISDKDKDNTWVQMDSTGGSSKKYVWSWGDMSIVKKISVLKTGDKVIIRWYMNDRLRIKDIGVVKFK